MCDEIDKKDILINKQSVIDDTEGNQEAPIENLGIMSELFVTSDEDMEDWKEAKPGLIEKLKEHQDEAVGVEWCGMKVIFVDGLPVEMALLSKREIAYLTKALEVKLVDFSELKDKLDQAAG